MSTGGLEDLFGQREEPPVADEPAPERRRSWTAWALRNLLLIALATVVVVAVLRSADYEISIIFVVTALAGLRLILLAVAEVRAPAAPKRSDRRAGSDGSAGTDSLRAAVRRWEQNLERANAEDDLYSRNVLPVLAELTDERLRLRHGITRATDPRRARELLGEPLWEALHERGRRMPKARDLESYVDVLERL
ncbi:hypothetical protein KOI35_35415 [Actinoplanes bogorensis]|uniref:DUF4129 domain-containing protein n=1 Tax=Paractinoplanes bogorensis TaxID=1610840 RepID=A0ABS5YZE3_9ACTN|nr:hypothetical protein [Actinoplanes bogorensis]MBU2668814.1 hypothetical protein [Actinoplanes bogorensis]